MNVQNDIPYDIFTQHQKCASVNFLFFFYFLLIKFKKYHECTKQHICSDCRAYYLYVCWVGVDEINFIHLNIIFFLVVFSNF